MPVRERHARLKHRFISPVNRCCYLHLKKKRFKFYVSTNWIWQRTFFHLPVSNRYYRYYRLLKLWWV